MNIQAGTLIKLVPPDRRGNIKGPNALAIVHKQFCGPMTVRGYCTSDCAGCRDALLSAFSLDKAGNPEALLTWRFKNELTRQQEAHASKPPEQPKTDVYGVPVSEQSNPFAKMAKQYAEQAKRS